MRHRPGGVGVTALVGRRSVHRSAKMVPRCRFGAFVYTVAPWAWVVGGLGITIVYTNGRIGPLRTGLGRLCTLLGCCAVVDRCEDAIVYTDRRKRPLGAVSGHLCTLLRLARCPVVTQGDAIVYTDRRKWPLGAVLGHLCTLLRRESRYESRLDLRQVARAPQSSWRVGGASSLAPLAWSGRQALSERRRR